MQEEPRFIQRCLELAGKGLGRVAPNPMVGCVVVIEGKIVGEGFHEEFGGPHAEVIALRNALRTVSQEDLSRATVYVSLEPCSHHGKTPPCTDLLIARGVKKVVIASLDPFEGRSGAGVRLLEQAGIETTHGVLKDQADSLNKRFFTFHQKKRPYIILKYAQTGDGFMAPHPSAGGRFWISCEQSRRLVHKWRTEETGIMVGANTARIDNPQLTARLWPGKNPVRMVVDRKGDLPRHLYLFDETVPTLIFSRTKGEKRNNVEYISLPAGDDFLPSIMDELHARNIDSVMVEGGRMLLDVFISKGLWDEARIFTAPTSLKDGIRSPMISGKTIEERQVGDDRLTIIIPS